MVQTSLTEDISELIDISIERIRKYEPKEGYDLAFSGGKDSEVIYDLAQKSGVDFTPHFHFTTVDPPRTCTLCQRKLSQCDMGSS